MSVFPLAALIPAIAAIIPALGAAVSTVQALRPSPRRRISYRVHLDSRIGARPDIKGLAELVVRRKNKDGKTRDVTDASLALVRVSNDGGLDIGKDDYVEPVTFTFGKRTVVGVEVKEVSDAQRAMLLGHKRSAGGGTHEDVLTFADGENWVRLPKMQLNKKDRFRMLVLLSGDGTGVAASGVLKSAVKGGGLVRDTSGIGPNRASVRAIAFLAATACLAAVSLVLLFLRPLPPDNVPCAAGNIIISGSTAFEPAATDIADRYHKYCSSSIVAVNPGGHPTGSHRGVLDLATNGKNDPNVQAKQLAMSDGPATGYNDLVSHPISVIIFSVVVNKATGIHSLTIDELRKIYSGQFTNWLQLHGPNLPINIVSRGSDSGTRSTFDQKLLDGGPGEPPFSSYNCTDRDPKLPASPVIRCEMSGTDELLSQVNTIPGAIGYAEMSVTSQAQPAKYRQVDQVQLDGHAADPESVKNGGYPFWTVEYFYSYGSPGKTLSAFLGYLSSDTAKTSMQSYGHIPCNDGQGNQIQLCR